MPGYDEGVHSCTIVSQGFGTTKNGTEYFGLIVMPQGGQYEREVSLWVNSEPNIERTTDRLKSLGWDGEDWTTLNPAAQDGHSFKGVTVTLVNRHSEKGYDNFDFPGPPPTVRVGSNDELAKKLNRLTNSGKKPAVTNVSPAVTNPSPVADEEVPF